MAANRNNVRAGIFVLIGITLAFVAIVVLADLGSLFQQMHTVRVHYPLSDGVMGLKKGAAVSLGGHRIGQVTEVRPYRQDDEGPVTGMLVDFEVPEDVTVYDNARIELVVPPLGSGTALNIASVGYPAEGPFDEAERPRLGESWVYQPTDPPIDGGIASSQIAADMVQEMGIRDREREHLRAMIRNVRHLSEALGGDLPDDRLTPRARNMAVMLAGLKDTSMNLRMLSDALAGTSDPADLSPRARRLAQTLEDLRASAADLRMLTTALAGDASNTDLPEQAARVANIVRKAETLATDLSEASQTVRTLVAEVREQYRDRWQPAIGKVLTGVEGGVDTINAVLDENRQNVRQAIASAREAGGDLAEITKEFKTERMKQIAAMLEKADKAVAEAKGFAAELHEMAVVQRPVVERALANVRLAADQLKLAMIEVRRSPWRIAYSPSREEIREEGIYDASRSFALAASTLESAAESMRVMLERQGGQIDPKDESVRLMLENLQKSFEKYSEVEQAFWDAIDDEPLDK